MSKTAKGKEPLTEALIQRAIWLYCGNSNAILPNTKLYRWESDALRISARGYITEFEIKISRADFLADKRKDRHHILDNGMTGPARPNYFYYVVPAEMINPSEIPLYAGLLYVYWGDYWGGSKPTAVSIRKAPELHSTKLSQEDLHQLLRSTSERYWRGRFAPALPIAQIEGDELFY